MSFSAIGLTTENISSFRDLDSGRVTLAVASLGRRAAYKQTGQEHFPILYLCVQVVRYVLKIKHLELD